MPQALRECLLAFEAGEPMVDVRDRRLGRAGGAGRARCARAVFVEEQQIPADLEWDDADDAAVHAVALNRLGMPLATGRLLQHAPGVGRIGRMAVHQAVRGSARRAGSCSTR